MTWAAGVYCSATLPVNGSIAVSTDVGGSAVAPPKALPNPSSARVSCS
jgi:hypothetical protein